ncbi:hypothetical protein M405DRAFT_135868 [Rhizopogon salebrosus TDB-379]|nr:hypothetical protein M405DRAFT_135868 [Rhizopogon salebrosus TDB-379]
MAVGERSWLAWIAGLRSPSYVHEFPNSGNSFNQPSNMRCEDDTMGHPMPKQIWKPRDLMSGGLILSISQIVACVLSLGFLEFFSSETNWSSEHRDNENHNLPACSEESTHCRLPHDFLALTRGRTSSRKHKMQKSHLPTTNAQLKLVP